MIRVEVHGSDRYSGRPRTAVIDQADGRVSAGVMILGPEGGKLGNVTFGAAGVAALREALNQMARPEDGCDCDPHLPGEHSYRCALRKGGGESP